MFFARIDSRLNLAKTRLSAGIAVPRNRGGLCLVSRKRESIAAYVVVKFTECRLDVYGMPSKWYSVNFASRKRESIAASLRRLILEAVAKTRLPLPSLFLFAQARIDRRLDIAKTRFEVYGMPF